MRTRMTSNVRKQALHALKPDRNKRQTRPAIALVSKTTARKKHAKPTKRTRKGGKTGKYKELHAVGRRSSSQFVTYSQDGRLFYDLYARGTPYSNSIKAAAPSTSLPTPNKEVTRSSPKCAPTSGVATPAPSEPEPSTKTRSVSRKQAAVVNEVKKEKENEDRKLAKRTENQVNDTVKTVRSGRSKVVSHKKSRPKVSTKEETAKVRLERKLKRELGVDSIPQTPVLSKRLASINAVAIINAVTKDSAKRPVSREKLTTPVRRRYSSETVPCVESKTADPVHEESSIQSDDALTEPMSLSPQASTAPKPFVSTPSTTPIPIQCTSALPLPKPSKVTQTVRKTRKSCPPVVVSTTKECISSPPKTTPVSTTQTSSPPCQELVPAKPQTSTVERYHAEQLIPLGPSGFGFQQITTQVIRYAQPDCTMLTNTNSSTSHPISAVSSPTVAGLPLAVRSPTDLGSNVHTTGFFDPNRAHTFLTSIALPMLTPMPAMTTWPTLIHPYTHMTQPLNTRFSHPNPTIFIPSLIPVPTQFQCSVMPNLLHPQFDYTPQNVLPPAPPHPPPPPALVPSPMCSLPAPQPNITPSFSLIRSVPPALYYSASPPSYPLRDSLVPIHAPPPAMTACTPSPVSLQVPICNQTVYPSSNPTNLSVPVLPPLTQGPQPTPDLSHTLPPLASAPTLISTPSTQMNAFTLTVPSMAPIQHPSNGLMGQSDLSKSPMSMIVTSSGAPVALFHAISSPLPSTPVPLAPVMSRSLVRSETPNPTLPLSVHTELVRVTPYATPTPTHIVNTNNCNTTSPTTTTTTVNSSVNAPRPPFGVDSASTTLTTATDATPRIDKTPVEPAIVVEPVIVCPVDGSQNAWQWEGNSYTKAVFCRSDGPPVIRTCYRAIRHRRDGMVIREKDCVLLCSGPDRTNPPHVAKITALFADATNPETKMMSLLWYYRPEHVGCSLGNSVPNELYASRHCDTNPVECIEDKAYVLTASAFARYMARLKYRQTSYPRPPLRRVVPARTSKSPSCLFDDVVEEPTPTEESNERSVWSDEVPDNVNPANVFLCRAVYDYRLKRVCRNVNLHVLPIHSQFLANRQRVVASRSSPPHLSPSPLSEDDAEEPEKSDKSSLECSPKPDSRGVADPADSPQHADPGPPIISPATSPFSTEPSPANSPSLCICLPESPAPDNPPPQNADSIVCSPKSVAPPQDISPSPVPTTTVANTGRLTPDARAASPVPSAAADRSSTPLKSRESTIRPNIAPCLSSKPKVCPPSITTTTTHVENQLPLTTQATHVNHCVPHGLTTVAQPAVCSASNSNTVWLPSSAPLMPLLESSVLETSADLSVNWAEHGEQIALSLDCRNVNKPVCPVPVCSSAVMNDSVGQMHQAPSGAIGAITWPAPLERAPVPATTELFGHPVALCPAAPTATTSANVNTHGHESDPPRLVML